MLGRKTKEHRAGLVRVPWFWKLRPSIIHSVPCDQPILSCFGRVQKLLLN